LFFADSREMQIENFVCLAHVLATVGRVPVSFVPFKIVIKRIRKLFASFVPSEQRLK
jgi:hypothetical protein